MSLSTGARITRRSWVEKSITQDVIDRVHHFATTDASPDSDPFLFEWSPNVAVTNDPLDPTLSPVEGADIDDTKQKQIQATQNQQPKETDEEISNQQVVEEEEIVEETAKYIEEESKEEYLEEERFEEETEEEVEEEILEEEEEEKEETKIQKIKKVTFVESIDDESLKFEERPLLEDYDLPEPEQIQLTEREERNIKRNDYRETVQQVESALDEEIIFEKDDSPEPPLFERIEPGFEHTSLFQAKKDTNNVHVRNKSWTSTAGKAVQHIAFLEAYRTVFGHAFLDKVNLVRATTRILLNQMTAKKGIKEFGDRAIAAIVKEFGQLDQKGVFDPVYKSDLTNEQVDQALRSITLIKEKRCGKVIGRTVADGRAQRKYVAPEDVHSPTVSIEGLLLTLAVDAKEGRHVATADVEGAYLHADMDEVVHMVFEGEMVDYMVQADPKKYGPYVHQNKFGKKKLYVRLLKALYGCIQSALLWWKLLTDTLEKDGFKVNPYDTCTANKTMSDGTQCTICWYVDDLKISHVREEVVDDVINKIEERFGKMTVTKGDRHTYLGMDIYFPGNADVQVLMKDYLGEAVEEFPEDCSAYASSPAATHLFRVNPNGVLLDEVRRKLLHRIVAKLLYVSKRARPDLLPAISFLTSRVTKADEDDWKKLKRVLQYVNSTIDLPLTLSIDKLCILKTWVDAAFAVHDDMKSHTGSMITLGKGAFHASSKRQKLNTKSSTEAELVGAGDSLPQSIWTANFLEAQGYKVEESRFFQDNQSAMKMEKNGRQSAGQRSRHIHIRYFFIKDRIDKGEINLVYCSTDKMVADYFTKPLQGKVFKMFRDVALGIRHPSSV